MNPPGKLAGRALSLIVCLIAAVAVPARPAAERILFENMARNDPVREVVQTVLGSKSLSPRRLFSPEEWSEGGYGAAWERARTYFPGQTFLVRPGTYFMTHGFDADGRLFMEIHESPYLTLCVENRRTFAPAAIVEEYARMRAAAGGREAAGFRDKMGVLEAGFLDDKAHRDLRKALGEPLYLRLLEELREENSHMLAAGLVHEGMHAELDEAVAARLQAGFKAAARAVQWDELRAFTAEIGCHIRFSGREAEETKASWARTGALLGELERFRRTSRLPSGSALARFDRVRSQISAYAALIRRGSRVTWQSARRIQELATGFRKDYVKGGVPADLEGTLAGLENEAAGFVTAAGEAIQSTELVLRSLEQVLETWGAWGAGRRPFPPPVTDSRAVVKRAGEIRWPALDPAAAASLMRRAGQALEKERPAS